MTLNESESKRKGLSKKSARPTGVIMVVGGISSS